MIILFFIVVVFVVVVFVESFGRPTDRLGRLWIDQEQSKWTHEQTHAYKNYINNGYRIQPTPKKINEIYLSAFLQIKKNFESFSCKLSKTKTTIEKKKFNFINLEWTCVCLSVYLVFERGLEISLSLDLCTWWWLWPLIFKKFFLPFFLWCWPDSRKKYLIAVSCLPRQEIKINHIKYRISRDESASHIYLYLYMVLLWR